MNSVLLFVEYKNKILSLLYGDNRLKKATVHESSQSEVGAIYIGKVKNVVPAIDACFVEYKKDCIGFLPLKQAKYAKKLNGSKKNSLVAGDEIMVQVETERVKTKAPGLTCNLSLRANYCVITLGKSHIGFSSKLKENTKVRLKDWLYQSDNFPMLQKKELGVVIRTNAAKLEAKEELDKELSSLLLQMEKIQSEFQFRTCFSCLYQPIPTYLSEVRDLYQWEYDKVVTDIPHVYEELIKEIHGRKEVSFYDDQKMSLSKLYSVSSRLKEALDEKVWLKSGAYLIIQPTEALTVIDVNSGKIQKKHPGDDIYFTINKEAAKEIAFQLKLRNISGIIIVDFINQNKQEQDKELLHYFSSLVKEDPVQTNVVGMTSLGLVEVTRKKVYRSLREQLI